jgi:hypothetical protein
MNEEWYDYDKEGDVLDVYFGERRAAWMIELTPNIMISIDRGTQQAIGLTLLDYTELSRRTAWGPRSFPVTGLADLPFAERDLVLHLLNTAPVNRWLDLSTVQTLPDSPFAVTHLEPPPPAVAALIPSLA